MKSDAFNINLIKAHPVWVKNSPCVVFMLQERDGHALVITHCQPQN